MPAGAETMPALPDRVASVAIVGRPNVGKSSLLNALARRRISIVSPVSGVTRDRVTVIVEYRRATFELCDMGGLGPLLDELEAEVRTQIDVAIRRADVILFVVDVRAGPHPGDAMIARELRRAERPVLLVANKVDNPKQELDLPEFNTLGMGNPIAVSALERMGCESLKDAIILALPEQPLRRPRAGPEMKIAVVGGQNVGKSTFINWLAREERMIVSEQPGTTRDSVDVYFRWGRHTFVAIDTAGIKRKGKTSSSIEFYAVSRAERSIRRCDVAAFMLDCTREISRTDKKIAGYIERQTKPCVLTINKWDVAGEMSTGEYAEYLNAKLPPLSYAPMVFVSATTGMNTSNVLSTAAELNRQARVQVGTGELNRAVGAAQKARSPRPQGGRVPKIQYAVQIGTAPPTFLMFCTYPRSITKDYRRYLEGFLRDRFDFSEVPLRIHFRSRVRRER